MEPLQHRSLLELISLQRECQEQARDLAFELGNRMPNLMSMKQFYPKFVPLEARQMSELWSKQDLIFKEIIKRIQSKYLVSPLVNNQLVTAKRVSYIKNLIVHRLEHLNAFNKLKIKILSSMGNNIKFAGNLLQFLYGDNNEKLALGFNLKFTQSLLEQPDVSTAMRDFASPNNSKQFMLTMDWTNQMYDFSLYDWGLLLIFFIERIKLINILHHTHVQYSKIDWGITHKLKQKPVSDYTNKFQLALCTLIHSSTRFQKLFCKTVVHCTHNVATENDLALLFDTSEWISDYLMGTCGLRLEDRKSNPSYTYYPDTYTHIIRDHKGILFDTLWIYMKYRINRSIAKHKKWKMIVSKRIIFKFHLKYIKYKLKLNWSHEIVMSSNKQQQYFSKQKFVKNVLPRRKAKLERFVRRMNANRRKCFVCKRAECYTINEMITQNGGLYINKLKRCPCGQILVCNKKCHKYAWSRLMHRDLCSHAI